MSGQEVEDSFNPVSLEMPQKSRSKVISSDDAFKTARYGLLRVLFLLHLAWVPKRSNYFGVSLSFDGWLIR
jgi:hypothetical protein